MRHLKTLLKSLLIASLSALPALSQTPNPTTNPPLAAYVYVSTAKGVYLYNAASTGKLTRVAGPYALPGLAIGSNGKYFISLGTDWIHVYPIATNGTIGKQVSQINTVLPSMRLHIWSHARPHWPIPVCTDENPGYDCTSEQTYKIANGQLTFLGNIEVTAGRQEVVGSPLAILANDLYAYNTSYDGDCVNYFDTFQRESAGDLGLFGGYANVPTAQSGWLYYPAGPMATDPYNNLAVYLNQASDDGYCTPGTSQLATYAGGDGDLYTSDTYQTMPTPPINVTVMNMSPAGNLLAVGGNGGPLLNMETPHRPA
jgi:hypothetical protein